MSNKQASDSDGVFDDDHMQRHKDTDKDKEICKAGGNPVKEADTEEGNLFASRHKLGRTPPQRRSSLPKVSGMEVEELEEEEERQSKRKREEIHKKKDMRVRASSCAEGSVGGYIKRVFEKIDAECKILAAVSKERNTRKEVKEASAVLNRLMTQIKMEEIQGLLTQVDKSSERSAAVKKMESDRQRLSEENVNFKKENARLRKEIDTLRSEVINATRDAGKGGEPLRIGREDIEKINSFGDFKKIASAPWRQQIYKNAFIVQGTPLKANRNTDIVCLMEEGADVKKNEGIMKTIVERFPEIEEIQEELGSIVIRTSVVTGGVEKASERLILKIELGEPANDREMEEDNQAWYNKLAQMRDLLVAKNRTRVALYPPGNDPEGVQTRKMLECILKETNIKGLVYVKETAAQRREKIIGDRGEKRETEVVWVKSDGKSYADLLKKIKEKVKTNTKAAKGIRTVREDRNGQMMIVVDKKLGGVEELKQQLIAGEDNINVTVSKGNKMVRVNIKDIDGLVKESEVAEALGKELGCSTDKLEVGRLRPYFGGNQAVTVGLESANAKTLIERGKVRIGLNMCLVQERVTVVQCYKCWKYGHRQDECREEVDRSTACRKCAKTGHRETECTEGRTKCLNCKVEGHKAGSGRCPEFKKALARAKILKKKKRAFSQ